MSWKQISSLPNILPDQNSWQLDAVCVKITAGFEFGKYGIEPQQGPGYMPQIGTT
jgi:hypothetical protein